MHRTHKINTKVWHNPEIVQRKAKENKAFVLDALNHPKQNRKLDALFSKPSELSTGTSSLHKSLQRKVAVVSSPPIPEDLSDQQKLLSKLLKAEGRIQISKAARDFLKAGFSFPEEEDVHLQLLEHTDEDQVRSSLEKLHEILNNNPLKRKNILESRLRRLEEFAEEQVTQQAANLMRKRISGRIEV